VSDDGRLTYRGWVVAAAETKGMRLVLVSSDAGRCTVFARTREPIEEFAKAYVKEHPSASLSVQQAVLTVIPAAIVTEEELIGSGWVYVVINTKKPHLAVVNGKGGRFTVYAQTEKALDEFAKPFVQANPRSLLCAHPAFISLES
jgi:hypothetical protein